MDILEPDEFFDRFLDDAGPGRHDRPVDGPIAQWGRWWRAALIDEPVVGAAAQQGFVLTTARLAELGVTRSQARWAIEHDRWTAPARGMVAPIDVRRDLPEHGADAVLARRIHTLRGSAAALCRPASVVSAGTAAIMRGLPTFAIPDTPVLNRRDWVGMGRRSTAHLLTGQMDSYDVTSWFGVAVASVARALVDLARIDRRDAVIAGDAALHEGVVDRAEIERVLTRSYKWPGVRQAREVLELLDGRAESPLESLVRLALHDDGFPPPEPQVWIGADRVDFFWPRYRLVLEADGRAKYADDALWREKRREQRLRRHRDLVKTIERVTWSETVDDWPATSARLRPLFR